MIRQILHPPFPGFIDRGNHLLMRALKDRHIAGIGGIHPGIRPEPAFDPIGMFQFKGLRHGFIAIIRQRMLDVRRIAQLTQVVTHPHTFNEAQRKLRLFTAGEQLQHLAYRHIRREAIGPGFKVGQLRLDAQQPLEHPRAVNDFIAI